MNNQEEAFLTLPKSNEDAEMNVELDEGTLDKLALVSPADKSGDVPADVPKKKGCKTAAKTVHFLIVLFFVIVSLLLCPDKSDRLCLFSDTEIWNACFCSCCLHLCTKEC